MKEPLREKATYWRAPEYGGMELLDATYIRHRFPLHFHEEYAICVIERGHYEFYFEGSHQRVEAGSLVLINPGEVHSGHAIDKKAGHTVPFIRVSHSCARLPAKSQGKSITHRPLLIPVSSTRN